MSVVGKRVKTKKNKIGVVFQQDEKSIYVRFPEREIRYDYPSRDRGSLKYFFLDKIDLKTEFRDFLVNYIVKHDSWPIIPKHVLYIELSKKFVDATVNDISHSFLSEVIEILDKDYNLSYELNNECSMIKIVYNDVYKYIVDYVTSNKIRKLTDPMISDITNKYYSKQSTFKKEIINHEKLVEQLNQVEGHSKYIIENDYIIISNHELLSKSLYKDYGLERDEQGNVVYEKLIQVIIKIITKHIISGKYNEFSLSHIENYLETCLFTKYGIKRIDISNDILSEILISLNDSSEIRYEKVRDSVIRKIDEVKSENVVSTIGPSSLTQNKKQLELLTKPGVVSELIKSLLITDFRDKIFYTLYELKDCFINNYYKDPGDLITRELLINLCIELSEEEDKHFFVEGDGNSLQLWKASSLSEWRRKGFGTVYIPTIKIKDKEFNIKDFTLYVYESLNNNCRKTKGHDHENVTINTIDILGVPVSFNAFYCSSCNKYYTTIDTVSQIFPLYKYPFVKLNYVDFSGNYRRNESELMMYGYSVKADGPSDVERQELLSRLLMFNIMPKSQIVSIIRDHINYNGKAPNMSNAVKRWEEDLSFVQNYGLSKQREVNTNSVNIVYGKRKRGR